MIVGIQVLAYAYFPQCYFLRPFASKVKFQGATCNEPVESFHRYRPFPGRGVPFNVKILSPPQNRYCFSLLSHSLSLRKANSFRCLVPKRYNSVFFGCAAFGRCLLLKLHPLKKCPCLDMNRELGQSEIVLRILAVNCSHVEVLARCSPCEAIRALRGVRVNGPF